MPRCRLEVFTEAVNTNKHRYFKRNQITFLGKEADGERGDCRTTFLIRTPPPIKTINEVHEMEISDLVKSLR